MFDLYSNDFICYDTEPYSDNVGFDMMSDIYVSKWKRSKFSANNNFRRRDRKYRICISSNEGDINYNVKNSKPPNGFSNMRSSIQTDAPEASVEKLINCHNYEVDSGADVRDSSSVVFKNNSRFFRRSQIMPRFSNMIQNHKKYYRTKFKNLFIDSFGEPYCFRCEKRRIKKINKIRHNYAFRSVYTDAKVRIPVTVGLTNGLRSPLYYNAKTIRNRCSKASLSSLASIDSQFENYTRLYKYNKRVHNYILKHDNQARKFFKNKKLQCPSKTHRNQIIATPCWEENNCKTSEQNGSHCSVLPSTSSGFWEYLIDKIIKKQTVNECDMSTNCPCAQSETCMKGREPIRRTEQRIHECVEKVHEIGSGSKESNLTRAINDRINSDTSRKVCPCDCKKKKISSKDAQTSQNVPEKTCGKVNKEENKEPEKCEVEKKECKKSKTDVVNKPCRSPHDEVAKRLERKYNGEILCIHNPPCILINGCLNLPSVAAKPATACWPVTQVKKPSIYNLYKRMWADRHKTSETSKNNELSCTSSSKCQLSSPNKNKMNQTFCQKPFCNLVKLCCKPKYGICSEIAYTHVPTFKKSPKYLIQTKCDDQVQKSRYSQAIKLPRKFNFNSTRNKTSIPLPSNTIMLSTSVEKAFLRPSSVPVYHKNRLLRKIKVKH